MTRFLEAPRSDYIDMRGEATRHRRRFALIAVVTVLGMILVVPAAGATPSEETLDKAKAAMAKGQEKAKGLAKEPAAGAPGQENRAKGLERAEAAIAAAAAHKAAKAEGKADGEKPGRGLGRGHADEVHAALFAGGSPSDIPSHGQAVSTLAKAFKKVKDNHPGQGNGQANKGDDDGDDDADDGDDD